MGFLSREWLCDITPTFTERKPFLQDQFRPPGNNSAPPRKKPNPKTPNSSASGRSHPMFRLLLITSASLLAGCSAGYVPEADMSPSFHPPGIQDLTEIDIADVQYGNEPIVIDGVVAPGQGGWPGRNSTFEVHSFSFFAWKRVGEAVKKRGLTVLRAVAKDADFWSDFPDYSIQRISVWMSTDETRAVFVAAWVPDTADPELQAISQELQRPIIASTERFGNLVFDRRLDRFEVESKWQGATIQVNFPVVHGTPDSKALATAERLWTEEDAWNTNLKNSPQDNCCNPRTIIGATTMNAR